MVPVCPRKPWGRSEQVRKKGVLSVLPAGPTEMSLHQTHRGAELIQNSGIQNLRGVVKNASSWASLQTHRMRI